MHIFEREVNGCRYRIAAQSVWDTERGRSVARQVVLGPAASPPTADLGGTRTVGTRSVGDVGALVWVAEQLDLVGHIDRACGGVGAKNGPSVGELVGGVDIDALYAQFVASPNQTFAAGTYDDVGWGDWSSSDLVTTYVTGDLRLAGTGSGAGVLVVDGDLDVTGEFEFAGIIIVTGDVRFTGGGSGTHLWGSLMTKGSAEVDVSGSAEIIYSSVVLDTLETSITTNSGYSTVYYGERN